MVYNIIPNIFVQIYLNSLLHYMSHCCLVGWYERFLGLRVTTVSFGKNVYYLFVRFTNFLDLLLSHYNYTRTRVGLLAFNSLTHLLYIDRLSLGSVAARQKYSKHCFLYF